MFFTQMGRVVAILALVLGLFSILWAVAILSGLIVEPAPGRYLNNKTTGQWIDRGIYLIVFGIVVGVITDISRSVAKGNQAKPE